MIWEEWSLYTLSLQLTILCTLPARIPRFLVAWLNPPPLFYGWFKWVREYFTSRAIAYLFTSATSGITYTSHLFLQQRCTLLQWDPTVAQFFHRVDPEYKEQQCRRPWSDLTLNLSTTKDLISMTLEQLDDSSISVPEEYNSSLRVLIDYVWQCTIPMVSSNSKLKRELWLEIDSPQTRWEMAPACPTTIESS